MNKKRFDEIQGYVAHWEKYPDDGDHYDMLPVLKELIAALAMANENYADLLDRHEQLLRSQP